MTLLSNSPSDRDESLEPASAMMSASAHSLSGMAAVGGFGVSSTGPPSVTSASVDTSSRRSSLKQRRRSGNIIRAPIASAEELSPTSPQGLTPSGSEGPDVHQLPVVSQPLNGDKSDMEFRAPGQELAAHGRPKVKSSHKNTYPNSEDDILSAASDTKLSSYKPASELVKTTNSVCAPVSDHSQSYGTNNSLPASLPSLPGAVRRPHSFVHAMSDQLVMAAGPRHGRGARSPSLETQPEEELSGIFEFSV